MPTFIDAIVLLSSPKSASEVSTLLSHLLDEHKLSAPDDSMVVFNDHNGLERDPEYASSNQEALRLLAENPSLGGIQIDFAGQKVSIFLYGLMPFSVNAISLSVLASGYLSNQRLKELFDGLIQELHSSLSAKRTISDFELLSPDSFWRQEVARLKDDIFEQDYLVDLR